MSVFYNYFSIIYDFVYNFFTDFIKVVNDIGNFGVNWLEEPFIAGNSLVSVLSQGISLLLSIFFIYLFYKICYKVFFMLVNMFRGY